MLSVSSDPWREKTAEGCIVAALTRARSRMFSTSIPNNTGSLSRKRGYLPQDTTTAWVALGLKVAIPSANDKNVFKDSDPTRSSSPGGTFSGESTPTLLGLQGWQSPG